jgi:GAF domain-containing protein
MGHGGEGADGSQMEPIPETVEAVDNLDPSGDEVDLLAHLRLLSERAQAIVPDLVGVSVARLDHGLTFTLVATDDEVAVLDAVQYVAGGPCVEGARDVEIKQFERDDALDEERWRLFAEATAAHTVRSTLTLPVVSAGRAVGSVNLYSASRRVFEGQHEVLAEIFGAWAAGAVANADLSFTTRIEAEAAPRHVQDRHAIDVATGIVAAQLGVDVQDALTRLGEAAEQAGVSLLHLARDIVHARRHQDHDGD